MSIGAGVPFARQVVQQQRHEADWGLASDAEIKNMWSCPSTFGSLNAVILNKARKLSI
jgi:hypothetical protein